MWAFLIHENPSEWNIEYTPSVPLYREKKKQEFPFNMNDIQIRILRRNKHRLLIVYITSHMIIIKKIEKRRIFRIEYSKKCELIICQFAIVILIIFELWHNTYAHNKIQRTMATGYFQFYELQIKRKEEIPIRWFRRQFTERRWETYQYVSALSMNASIHIYRWRNFHSFFFFFFFLLIKWA